MLFDLWLWTVVVRFERHRARFVQVATTMAAAGQEKDARMVQNSIEAFDRELAKIRADHASGALGICGGIRRIHALANSYADLRDKTTPVWRQLFVVLAIFIVITKFVGAHYFIPSGSAEPTMLVGDHIFGNKFVYFFKDVKRGDYAIVDDPTFKYDPNPIRRWWQQQVGFGIPLLSLPDGPAAWTKRIIAVPGDTIEGRVEDGCPVIYLNGNKLAEPYVNPYPLIAVVRRVGFINSRELTAIPLLSSLAYQLKEAFYTYDDHVGFSEQPFYKLSEREVVRNPETQLPFIKLPHVAEMYDTFPPVQLPADCYWAMGDSRRNSTDSRVWGFLPRSLIRGRVSRVLFSIDTEEPWSIFELIKHPIDFWLKKFRWNRIGKNIH